MHTPLSQFRAGVIAELPIMIGVIPFALIFGVLASSAGLPPYLAWSTSHFVFAGSAQFLAIPLFAEQAPPIVLIMTTAVINLRHLLYSASLAPYARHLSWLWKILLSYLLTDEAYVPTILHYQNGDVPATYKHYYWLGAGLTLWIIWQITTGIGILVGAQLPEGLGLDFTLALTFIAMLVPTIKNWPMIASALTAGICAVLTINLPYRLNLIIAAVIGIAVGLGLELYQERRDALLE
ncbi:MAG: AzlC family ABC transporter permease [Chloroflexota bacterium]